MKPRGHIGVALLAFTPVLISTWSISPSLSVVCGILTVIAAVIPDVDVYNVGLLSRVKHRGITHSIWFGFGLSGLVLSFYTIGSFLGVFNYGAFTRGFLTGSVFLGFTTHIVVDSFTPMGVNPITPIRAEYMLTWDIWRSKNAVVNNTALILGIMSMVLGLALVVIGI